MAKRVSCKFFAQGACLKGDHCHFAHGEKGPTNNVCSYYQRGMCSFGGRCRYEHVEPSRSDSDALSSPAVPKSCVSGSTSAPDARAEISGPSSSFLLPPKPAWDLPPSTQYDYFYDDEDDDADEDVDADEDDEVAGLPDVKLHERPLCSFAAAGECHRGEKCPHLHGDLCPSCGKNCLHPSRPEEREQHARACEKKQKHLEALQLSQEIECSVCLERVLSKPTVAERKFGLLSECDHPFCVSCIRNWRNSSPASGMDALRACPICRKLSYFVIPSIIWYSSKEEKQEIIDNYKAKLSSINCKHFNFGNGNCPFGTSCFYKHTVKQGSYLWKYNRPPPRRHCPRRSSAADMDQFYAMFQSEIFGEDDEDFLDLDMFHDENLTPMEMALFLMELDLSCANFSSDEEDDYSFSSP